MDELRRAMLDAGAPRDEWQAELPLLIEVGQKRVRRRRMIATGVAAAVVTVIGTTAALAGVPGLNKSDPDPVKDRHSGVYVEERLAPAEVERRCNIVLDNEGSDEVQTWVAGVDDEGRAVPAAESVRPVETRVGRLVELAHEGDDVTPNGHDGGRDVGPGGQAQSGMGSSGPGFGTVSCIIPQEETLKSAGGSTDGDVPAADDDQRVAELCSRLGGYEVRGWSLVAAASLDGIDAVFMSENGFAMECSITTDGVGLDFLGRFKHDDGRAVLPEDDTGRRDPDRYVDLILECSIGRPVVRCLASGVLGGAPDRHQIEVVVADGSIETSMTRDGAYAFVVEMPAEGDGNPRYVIRVRAPDGVVVWKDTVEPGEGPAGEVVAVSPVAPSPDSAP